jgi:hypothetical protein
VLEQDERQAVAETMMRDLPESVSTYLLHDEVARGSATESRVLARIEAGRRRILDLLLDPAASPVIPKAGSVAGEALRLMLLQQVVGAPYQDAGVSLAALARLHEEWAKPKPAN